MKIYFETAGGFGFFPGLNKPFVIESNKLKKEEAELLSQLINDADIKNIAAKNNSNNRSADAKNYTIAIEENGKLSTINFSDTDDNITLKNLVAYLKQKQKEETL